MKSHSVPRRLLRQFSFYDPHTNSERLWRYQRGLPPSPKASPKTATRIDGHFDNPSDASQEALIERRLAVEIEEPVNAFLGDLNDPSFVLKESHRRDLTRYITLLFNRSTARRGAAKHVVSVRNLALQKFLRNEDQLLTVATHWNLDAFFRGLHLGRLITPADVAKAAVRQIATDLDGPEVQESYAQGVFRALTQFDSTMFEGSWTRVYASEELPFILSDAPVVTWTRNAQGQLTYGVGVRTENVEIIVPVSPSVCLQVLPRVRRTIDAVVPSAQEVNEAQAAYATSACFSNKESKEIDAIVQGGISTLVMGENIFTVWHMPYDNVVIDVLMNVGRKPWP